MVEVKRSCLVVIIMCSCWSFTRASCLLSNTTRASYRTAADDSTSMNAARKKQALRRCHSLYVKASALFDDNFNFTSASMMEVLTEIRDIATRYKEADSLLADVYGKMAICYQDLGNDDEAVAALRKAKSLRKNKTPDRSLFNICLTLGNIFMKSYTYDSADYYFTSIENRLPEFRGLRSNEYHRLWNELGVLNYNYGDHKLALNYYEQALQQGLSVFPPDAEQIVMVQNNIIAVLLKLDRPQEAIRKYRALLLYNKTMPILYHNLGKTYQRTGKYDSALFFLKKAKSLAASDDVLRIKLFNNLAITHTALEDYDQAQLYLDRAILLNRKVYKTKNAALAYSYMSRARIFEKQNKIRKALQEYQAAIKVLHFDFNDSSIYSNPESADHVVSRPYFFECLHNKAAVFRKYYETSLRDSDLQAAFQSYTMAIQMMDIIRKHYSSAETKLLFNSTTHSIYGEAITIAFDLYERTKQARYKEAAFAFSEKAKMAVLAEALADLKIKKLSGIPADLLRQEQKLKQHTSRLLIRLSDAKDSLQSLKIRNDLAAGEIGLSKIQQQLEQNKRYRNLKYDQQPLQLRDIHDHLQRNEALIEYYLGERDAFIFTVTSETLDVDRISLSPSFFKALEKLKTSLYSAEDGSAYHGIDAAYTLYKFLIQPVMAHAGNKKRWIVVPDGALHYIPVEALVSDKTQKRFVLEDHMVRYLYSGAFLLLSPQDTAPVKNGSILAFAPFDHTPESIPGIQLLKASRKEIQALEATHYYNEAATKAVFLEHAGSSDVIHLATHAETFNEDPLSSFIAFYPGSAQPDYNAKLYMPEICNLDLEQTRMVVISACEAGGGKLMPGEGLMSLSRAFAFAGCPSIVTSLWKADDEASAAMMISLHRNLKDGYTKDEALQKAKLEYLGSDYSHRLKSPVYWANFVCIGDADALYKNYTTRYAIAGSIVFGLVVTLVFLKVRRRPAKPGTDGSFDQVL